MSEYFIYRALYEESDKGWVWTERQGVPSRTVVLLKNRQNGRSVYCEYREADRNFVNRYNDSHKMFDSKYSMPRNLSKFDGVIVISGWYREALGGIKQQSTADLEIRRPLISSWAGLRAACQHPDPGVRVATRLAVMGTWLALVGLVFALVPLIPFSMRVGLEISAALLVLGLIVCRGANRRA